MASREKADRQDDALGLARLVSALAIDSFPGSPLPNLIAHDLSALFQAGGWRLPLVEEPSPHDFEGSFGERFVAAAQSAGTLLNGTLYERYFDLDYAAVALLTPWETPSHLARAKAGDRRSDFRPTLPESRRAEIGRLGP